MRLEEKVPLWKHPIKWLRHRRLTATLGTEVITDAEAFLLGHYAEQAAAQSLAVPMWGWTNLLAHGSEDELRHARGTCPASGRSEEWRTARALLAEEVLTAAERAGSLHALQRDVLVPLELALMGRRDVTSWSTQQWVDAVRAALAHPHSPRA